MSRDLAASTAAEEEVYAQFGSHLVSHDCSLDFAVERVASLQRSLVEMRSQFRTTAIALVEEPADQEEVPEDPAPMRNERVSERHVVADPCSTAVPLGIFVVSIHPKTSFRRLHQMGSCSYRPGLDSRLFEELGAEMPHVSHYDARCKSCFRTVLEVPSADGCETASTSGSSSESEA